MTKYFICGLLCLFYFTSISQKVIVSKGYEIDFDAVYASLGMNEGQLITYLEKDGSANFYAFDNAMKEIWTRQVFLDDRDRRTLAVESYENNIFIVFAKSSRTETHIFLEKYNNKGQKQYTDSLITIDNPRFPLLSHTSEDQSKIALFSPNHRNSFYGWVINLYAEQIQSTIKYDLLEDSRTDFIGLDISNEGSLYLVKDMENSRSNREDHYFEVTVMNSSEDIKVYQLNLTGFLSNGVNIAYDNINNNLIVAGSYTERNLDQSEGVFYSKFNPSNEYNQLFLFEWSQEILRKVYGNQGNRKDGIESLNVVDIVLRSDGGILLATEIQKSYTRRSSFGDPTFARSGAWVDYIFEDMIVTSIHPDGSWDWAEVLHKRQFSQDDNAIYSSYFIFKVPSFLRVVYNDEIDINSTASSYEVFTDGTFKRNSILSTQYQKIRLRFQQAQQVSSSAIVVPSEYKSMLNWVRIDF